jgi:hypothetical protein
VEFDQIWLVGRFQSEVETQWIEWYGEKDSAQEAANQYRQNRDSKYTIKQLPRGTVDSKLSDFDEDGESSQ